MLLVRGGPFAQTNLVSTVNISGLNDPDGVIVDKLGNLFVASEPGKSVNRISPEGKSQVVVTYDSNDGLDFDRKWNSSS